ncbi:hypothetical protein T01_4389 [Trichinella spiralis]|uniref:Uncharacterized protein n=1 Tax=Trichinella spiralis TaxID=6334 RepID=A0A0V1AQ65_TRISP|nr:hypothetical protein T01_4389 [Trichinella spiralis]
MSENLEIFDSMVYCWGSVQLMWFVFVKEVDLPPRYAEKEKDIYRSPLSVGKKPHGSSGPIMTGIESTSVTMGMEMTDVPYNVTNVISAPNFKCLTAAAAFINGYQGPVKVGQNALNIKIDGGLSLTNAAFEKHEKFQSLVAESGYNIDKTYKIMASSNGLWLKCPLLFEEDRKLWTAFPEKLTKSPHEIFKR